MLTMLTMIVNIKSKRNDCSIILLSVLKFSNTGRRKYHFVFIEYQEE